MSGEKTCVSSTEQLTLANARAAARDEADLAGHVKEGRCRQLWHRVGCCVLWHLVWLSVAFGACLKEGWSSKGRKMLIRVAW